MPNIDLENNRLISFDGAELGLTVWDTEEAPEIVVVGVHGMNDYANAFHMAAPYWAARGVKTYAYDQRGFGRSVGRGDWPDEDLMREAVLRVHDLARAVDGRRSGLHFRRVGCRLRHATHLNHEVQQLHAFEAAFADGFPWPPTVRLVL